MIAIGGENLIDYLKQADGDVAAPGGSPFNVAMSMGKQGADVSYITPISSDDWGDQLHARLIKSNVRIGASRVDAPTTMAIVTVQNGVPSYVFKRDGTAERAVDVALLEDAMPSGCRVLHVGSLALADDPDAGVWVDLCARAKAAGVLISLDPNVRLSIVQDAKAYRARLKRMIGLADVIKLSDEDLEGLYPELSMTDAMAQVVHESVAKVVVVTCGQEDGFAYLSGAAMRFPVIAADPLEDTIGAGDTFMATLLTSLCATDKAPSDVLDNLDATALQIILKRCATAAALNCQREGCQPPTALEIDNALTESAS
jgi:fructokinase